ncbi:MAG TPA: hypothetical protein VNJ12_14645 [Candidatus Dormibacteraeota bacterium]|nr:hypothetical protein [Candidatus Dormibacteraeota bacterium]
MKRRVAVLAVMFLALAAVNVVLAQAQTNPFAGTWKLDVAKSTFKPGPAPKSEMRMWKSSGRVSVTGFHANGKPISYGYIMQPDGKQHATFGAIPNGANGVFSQRTNANTIVAKFIRHGKQIETTTFTVSQDGKMMTMTAIGTAPSGTAFDDVAIWEKQ